MNTTAMACPHCRKDLATTQRGSHCPPPAKGCGWLKCACGATVDVKRGLHTHVEHTPGVNRCGVVGVAA